MRPHGDRYDSRLTVPNVLTGLRIAMAAVAAAAFVAAFAERAAVVLCVIAVALDAFDGWYARTFAQCSSLGEHLDPIADKLLMGVVYGVLAVKMGSPLVWALVGLVALRELAMTAFRSYSLRCHRKFIPANRLGKAKMIVQSTVGVALVAYAYFFGGGFDFSPAVVTVPLAVILVLSYLSAFVYLRTWYAAPAATSRRPLDEIGVGADLADRSQRMVVGK
jgi:CDP-diacylglycerol--glycerol-3-phosphate 3-phosphatidyltransferase